MRLHTVWLTSPGISGYGTKLWLDGVEVHGVRAIDLHIGLDDPSILTVEMIVDGVNVAADTMLEEDDEGTGDRQPEAHLRGDATDAAR